MINRPSVIYRHLLRSTQSITRKAMSNEVVRSTAASGSQVYESKRAVHEYLLFHYGRNSDVLPVAFDASAALDFSERIGTIADSLASRFQVRKGRVLDLGCAVGGASFQLSQHFDTVVGIDYSQHFIDAANHMKAEGSMPYSILKQGDNFIDGLAAVGNDVDRRKVSFMQGDACNLTPDIGKPLFLFFSVDCCEIYVDTVGKFDVIVASNLLCRLPKPRKFLQEIGLFLETGGLLVLISPYSWLSEYTDKEEWIGATSGQDSFTLLQSILETEVRPRFSLVHKEDVPFLIREHERKYQLGVSDMTVWKLQA